MQVSFVHFNKIKIKHAKMFMLTSRQINKLTFTTKKKQVLNDDYLVTVTKSRRQKISFFHDHDNIVTIYVYQLSREKNRGII